jgi:uncharacterized membrane protein YjgN (DUF898 family)
MIDLEKTQFEDSTPPMTPPPLPATLGQVTRFSFDGHAAEYFGIWIVNIMLTVITLGFYSPWAKVRRLRYFYGHTSLADERFDFTGIPTRILVGRLIAFALYGVVLVAGFIHESLAVIAPILLLLAVPWLLRSTYRFNARNSKYRNSRFFFWGQTQESYKVYVLWGVLSILSLGLLFPYFFWKHKQYQFNRLSLGQLNLSLNATAKDYYQAIFYPYALVALTLIISLAIPLMAVLTVFAAMFAFPLMQGIIFKTTWSNVTVGESPLQCEASEWRYAWILIVNWMAKAISFGLLTPWAAIRLHRYQVESMSIFWQNDPNEMLTLAQQDPSAFGEELSDIMDLDVSL